MSSSIKSSVVYEGAMTRVAVFVVGVCVAPSWYSAIGFILLAVFWAFVAWGHLERSAPPR
jgi:hypothetical protein